ncbi:NHL repeat-containing protein [Galbibacter mesophilus]|uniref:6-bladed beta-propeller n=1 Tax=Galbibacter mesophilus TaxID=379069 RepID=UPI001F5C91D2|nr:6-bladed beta-propeller [Galbibacter mesophilus]MCM5663389.1 6-bladed beta-propeller [Galbibacter mesophilus]
MKKTMLAASAGMVLPTIGLGQAQRKSTFKQGEIIGHGDFTYKVDKEWGVQDPAIVPINDCHEMVMGTDGRLFLTVSGKNNKNILIYDKSGKVLDAWGDNFPGAHGLTLAGEGSDQFLLITDPEIHKVFKTTLDGKIIHTFNAPKEYDGYKTNDLFKPTETAVAPNGDIYIADGYGENYITQYNSKGEFIRYFGGKGDTDTTFDCCHGITVDLRDPNNPCLLITSRSKQEFKRFTMDGQYLETIKLPGASICRPVIHGKNLYFAVIVTDNWWIYDGMVAVLNEKNEVVSLPGGSAPKYVNGEFQKPEYDGHTFLNPHDVCIDNDENIYVPQWFSGKTYPVKLHRV